MYSDEVLDMYQKSKVTMPFEIRRAKYAEVVFEKVAEMLRKRLEDLNRRETVCIRLRASDTTCDICINQIGHTRTDDWCAPQCIQETRCSGLLEEVISMLKQSEDRSKDIPHVMVSPISDLGCNTYSCILTFEL